MKGVCPLKDKNLHKISVYDVLLIGSLLIVPILSLSSIWQQGQGKKEAFIYHNNRLLEIHNLSQDRVISISDKGIQMMFKIDKGRIRVLESNCPKHVCVHTGWISNSGQTIVCVPNKLLVEVKGKQNLKYHAESY